jgi:exopolysaccharide production protein ExoQ
VNQISSDSKIDGILLLLAFILANLRATMFIYLYPDTSVLLGPAWIEIFLWLLIALLAVYNLTQNNQLQEFLWKWRRNWLLVLFISLTFLSAFWSIGPVVTSVRAFELLFVSLIAAYVGMRYRPNQVMDFLFWFGAIVLMLSIAIVYSAPKTGTMYWVPFYGAWRGLFWHRNHLASITTLVNMIFLCRMIIAFENRDRTVLLEGFFYVLSLVVLFFAKSATGYILLIVLHIVVFCIWLWLKVSHRMQRRHYYMVSGISILGLILILSNLDFVLGFFHRDSTLTGRAGLWRYLLQDVVSQRPWLGHGFGAVWTFDSFREQVRLHIGWTSQPLIADNGFLDILLHLGGIGFLVFLGILILAFVRSFRYALAHKTLSDFFPMLVILYAVLANIAFSLFAETEVFVWFLIVLALFLTTPAFKEYVTLPHEHRNHVSVG